ncbi:zinc ABC transporter substrate-binding protein ZnuA [Basfia succiniciproducens]|uniref:zinc ABC transporter substrate-binding protein ZnuA n=1 Tax=Basfia succiniciproducens TaxID=653940 RepID=UPI003FCD2928
MANRLILKQVLLAAILSSAACAVNAKVVASIKPLGFIASSIADGVTETDIVVPTGASPHDYSLKPTDVKKLKSADLLLWIGEDVDSFLAKSIGALDNRKVITIAKLDSVAPLLGKATHHHKEHDHEHHHADHEDEHQHDHDEHDKTGLGTNWHIWYSPEISKMVAAELAEKLTERFPVQKELIAENLLDFNRTLNERSDKIKLQLAAVKDKGFYVFHDAYGYFNDAYGLKQTGYFTINPLVSPGAKTLATIKEEIAEHKVSCLFAEPQFTPKVIESLSKGTGVHVGRLDPMGDKIQLGKRSYADFLQFTADSYGECLAK